MRDIKFKGQRVDNKGRISGDLISFTDNRFGIISHEEIPLDFDALACAELSHEVIPETVGQYTEFIDIRGEEIYEKDDVRCNTPYGDVYYSFIELNDGCWEVAASGKWNREYLKVLVANHAIEVVDRFGTLEER